MADPYRYYYGDEDPEELDPAVAEAIALDKAIQNSLESFTQQHGTTIQVPSDTVEVPKVTREGYGDTRDIEVPQLRFTAEEIAQDDLRRERELYGPPSPPRRPRILAPLNSTTEALTPRAANTIDIDANVIAYIVEGMAKNTAWKSANDIEKNPEKEEWMMEDKPTAEGASSGANTMSDPLTCRILENKMIWLLGKIHCGETRHTLIGIEDAVAAATAEHGWKSPSSSIAGVKGTVSDSSQGSPPQPQAAGMAGKISSQSLASSKALNSTDSAAEQVVMGVVDKTVADDNEAASVGGSARLKGSISPIDDFVGLDVPHDANESDRVGQKFDDMVARAQAFRLAEIEAELDSHLDAALQASHARPALSGAPAASLSQASGDQNAPTGPSSRAVGHSAGAEELEWFLDEPLGSPRSGSDQIRSPGSSRSGSEQMQSPRQKSQAQ